MVAVRQLLPVEINADLPPGSALLLDGSGLNREQFLQFCLVNPNLRIERDAHRQIIIMAPTSSETGRFNAEISAEIVLWNRLSRAGYVFDSSTGFTLCNGAERAPDTAWIARERWDALPPEQQQAFAPITPDFVLELRSRNDNLSALQAKMGEYMACGCRMGWLVDPTNRQTLVYLPDGSATAVPFNQLLSGAEVMPGLEVRMGALLGLD